MTTTVMLQAAVVISAAVILWRAEKALNLMGPNCRVVTRVAFWLLAVGAVAAIIEVSQGYAPSWADALTYGGLAALLMSERRFKSLLRLRPTLPPPGRVTQ